MILILKEIPLDSPFAFVNEQNFPKAITYPCQLRVSYDSTYFPVQAYLTSKYVEKGEIGLSNSVIQQYGISEGMEVDVQTRKTFDSVAHRLIIDKVKGKMLNKEDMDAITKGFMNAEVSPSHSSAFLLSQHFTEFSLDEIEAMARSFADSGKIHDFAAPVFDKHSIGGVPGNKITLLIVPILAAAGLLIPKTSTHAITSASGTADTMSVLAPVELNADEVFELVKKTKGCIVSGRDMGIAPVVDKIIKEAAFPLGIDPESLFLAGILAKKIAMGVDFMCLDIPVGGGTKVESEDDGRTLARLFVSLASRLGIKAEAGLTYANVPVGHSIGPTLEAAEALDALAGKGPTSLVEKSCELSGIIFEMAGMTGRGLGKPYAADILQSGKALKKMREIISGQGGDPKITSEELRNQLVDRPVLSYQAPGDGWPHTWNNYALKEIARAAGAPGDRLAGIQILSKKESVRKGEEVFRVYASSDSALDEVRGLIAKLRPVIVESVLLERVA
ncbi:MAG: AMP phosphorylase [Candidatus Hodarchaeales archaeon]|jgi:AMP phosphorylase